MGDGMRNLKKKKSTPLSQKPYYRKFNYCQVLEYLTNNKK